MERTVNLAAKSLERVNQNFKVISGYLILKVLDNSDEFVSLQILSEGDVVCPTSLAEGTDFWLKPLTNSQIVLSDSIPLVDVLASTKTLTSYTISSYQQRRAAERVLNLLTFYRNKFCISKPSFDFHLSCQDIAELVGSTRITINRILLEMQNSSQIKIEKRRISFLR